MSEIEFRQARARAHWWVFRIDVVSWKCAHKETRNYGCCPDLSVYTNVPKWFDESRQNKKGTTKNDLVYISKILWTTPIISLHLGTIALWSFTSTTLYAIRFLRSDENIIFPAVMPSVRMLIPQDKRVIWHMIAKRHSSWLLILKSAEQSKKELAGCVFCEATKISFFRLWCQACGYWSRGISEFYDTWLRKDAAVGFLFWRARNKAKRKLLSALDNRRWNKTQTKLEIDNLQSQQEYWI